MDKYGNTLTDKEIDQIDLIQTIAYNAMSDLLNWSGYRYLTGKLIEDNPEWIDRLAQCMCDIAVEFFGKDPQDIYPTEGDDK